MTGIRLATAGDARYVGEHIRPSDIAEMKAMGDGMDPVRAVVLSVALSDLAFTVVKNGVPLAVCGIVTHVLGDDVLWALGTEESDRYPRLWVRLGRLFPAYLMKRTGSRRAGNRCPASSVRVLRWLESIGFRTEPEEDGEVRFTMEQGG